MNKLFKTILISSIVIFGAGFLFASPANAFAVVDPSNYLIVEWSVTGTDPWQPLTGAIFSEANFLPGSGVTRYIRVTNHSVQSQRIAIEAIHQNDSDHLASQMNLVINQGGTNIFNDTLRKFFDQGETYLSELAMGAIKIYDLIITFNSDANNDYQAKTLGFDLLVGFEGTEGGLPLPPPGGGTVTGGGGVAPTGLTIQGEATFCVSATDAIITWGTSYNSTSRVVYGTHGGVFNLLQTNYGYDFTTPEIDNALPISVHGVTGHMVDIIGLTPDTKYYYKVISHASPDTVGGEFSFTTLGPGEKNPCCAETAEQNLFIEQPAASPSQGQGTEEEGGIAFLGDETGIVQGSDKGENAEVITLGEQPKEEQTGSNFSNFLASIANFFNLGNYCGSSTLLITILTILYLLSRRRKKETGETKKHYLDLIIAAAVLIILFFLLKCQLLIIPIIILIVYLFIELLKKEK
ncbi:MAG: fibronectin type III domain-containing protein [Candidatus Nealsonbacteria bacterium]|nr:fibronectin type III domain-containing protein [Candidatus Nealsonbacteria bacterium]